RLGDDRAVPHPRRGAGGSGHLEGWLLVGAVHDLRRSRGRRGNPQAPVSRGRPGQVSRLPRRTRGRLSGPPAPTLTALFRPPLSGRNVTSPRHHTGAGGLPAFLQPSVTPFSAASRSRPGRGRQGRRG